MSGNILQIRGLASAVILLGALTGCATYEKHGSAGGAGDAQVTQNVQSLFDQHPELRPPNSIQVQTLNHVIYLHGLVGQGLQSRLGDSVALGAPGVTRVVNMISITR